MTNLDPKCPQCRVAMEQGFLLDRAQGSGGNVAQWVEGEPGKVGWTGIHLKHRRLRPIVSYRCPRCGLLLDFAREKEGSSS
jgi:phage FluMu protein Com